MNVSPIERLPPELLSTIFTFYCGLFGKRQRGPFILQLVCQRWRTIAWNTRVLWTSVGLSGSSAELVDHVPAINRWFARSGNLLCSFSAWLWTFSTRPTSPTIYAVSHILCSIASRVQSLTLSLTAQEMYDFLDLFDRGLPQLRRIQLSINDSATESCRRPLSFLSSPKLDSVVILSGTGISRFLNDKKFLDAFPQSLRVVDQYVDLQPTTILSLLSKFRGLEVIILRLCETGGGLLPEDTKFCFLHTSLRHLHLAFAGAGIRSLFRAVQFPFLRSLSLSFIKESAGILELVAEASPPLERLALNCFKVGTDELLRFLEQTPTITHLSLVECDCFNWSLISSLTLSRRNRVQYLPKPEYFEIGNESDTVSKVPSEDLIEFVESRWWYSSLSTVVIWEDEEREEEEWQEHVSTMRDEGLEYFMDTVWKDCWDCSLDVDWLETR